MRIIYFILFAYLFLIVYSQSSSQNNSNVIINISALQVNDTEIEWIKNDTIFYKFANYFDLVVGVKFENQYCSEIKEAYQGINYKRLSSLFNPILESLLKHRCDGVKCKLSNYWNSTCQNLLPMETYYAYLTETIYLIFPFFLMCIMFAILIAFCNCLYFNYCYCCCFKLDTTKKEEKFFSRLFVFLAISSSIYIAGGVFNESRFESLNTYTKYTLCQIINNNVFQVVTGINITEAENKGAPDPKINWSGLKYLNTTFRDYMTNLNNFRTTLLAKKFLTKNDPLDSSYTNLQKGIEAFKTYSLTTDFSQYDPNGLSNPLFNITYVCNKCKDVSKIDNAYREINQTLYVWQKDMSKYRQKIYDELIDEQGWNNFMQYHNNTIQKIKLTLYKSYKFYNIVMTNYDTYQSTIGFFSNIELIIFIVNSIICIFGMIGYRLVRKSIDQVNEINLSMNYKGALERENVRVKNRWSFHLVINFNMITAAIISLYSFFFILIAVFVYESGTVMENDFYNKTKFYNFSFIPNGDLIDLCISPEPKGGHLNDYFNFTNIYNYYTDMINKTKVLELKYESSNLPTTNNYKIFKETTNNVNLGDFESSKDSSIRWDIDGEQINYFLFPLTSYKYIKTPPKEVLQEFTDFSFKSPQGSNYVNRQAQYCRQFTSYDVWADSATTCKNVFNVDPIIQISSLKDPKFNCFPITIYLSTEEGCPDLLLPNCFITYYASRYGIDLDFNFCDVPKSILDINFVTSSKDYFKGKINSLLTFAKYEDLNKKVMDSMLTKYRSNSKTMVQDRFDKYLSNLKEAYNFYITLRSDFNDLRKLFITYENTTYLITGELDKTGIMKNTNCSFIKSNEKIFYFSRSLISEEFFGLSIVFLGLVLFLFINASIAVVIFLKLRSDKELSEIRKDMITIKAIEDKERKYFFKPNVFIETDDARTMGIELDGSNSIVNTKKLTNRISSFFFSAFKRNKKINDNQQKNSLTIHHENEPKNKTYDIIDRFVKREEKEFEKRMQKERNDKI